MYKIGAISACNTMLSSHQPYECYPEFNLQVAEDFYQATIQTVDPANG